MGRPWTGRGVGFRLVANEEAGREKADEVSQRALLDRPNWRFSRPDLQLVKGKSAVGAGQRDWHRWHPAW